MLFPTVRCSQPRLAAINEYAFVQACIVSVQTRVAPSSQAVSRQAGAARAQETRCFEALADLYGALGETEMLAGAWQRRGAADETRAALSCLQHGQLERAQALLADALRRAASGWPAFPGARGMPAGCNWQVPPGAYGSGET